MNNKKIADWREDFERLYMAEVQLAKAESNVSNHETRAPKLSDETIAELMVCNTPAEYVEILFMD